MKKKLVKAVFALAVAVFTVGSFNSCKDYEEDKLADMKGSFIDENAALRELLKTQNEKLENLKDELTTLKNNCQCTPEKAAQLQALIDLFKNADGTMPTSLSDVINQIIENNATLLQMKSSLLQMKSSLSKIEGWIGTMPDNGKTIAELLADLQSQIDQANINVSDELNKINIDLTQLKAQVKSDSTWIADFEKNYGQKYDDADQALKDSIEALRKTCNELADSIASTETLCKKYTDDAIKYVVDTLNTSINAKFSDIRQAFAAADQALQAQIDTIKGRLDILEPIVEQNSKDIAELKDRVSDLEDALARLVTGVIVQATENPVFGSVALPLDVRSNVLMAYYGVNTVGARTFPSLRPGAITEAAYDPANVISSKELAMLGTETMSIAADAKLLEDEEGNAGTIYLTVNPNTVNFEGLTFELVNSQDEMSKVTLSPLEKSNKVLTFGITRAADNNGFYEAKATLKADDIDDVKINIESGLKSEMKNVLTSLKNRNNVSVQNLISKIYNQFNGILPANGVKATWTDSLGEHSVYSQYNIAATTFKPLSYKFLENTDLGKLPTITPLNYIEFGNFEDFNFKVEYEPIKLDEKLSITFKEIELNGEGIEVTVLVDKYDVVDGQLVVVGQDEVKVDGLDDFIKKLQDQLNDQITGENGWGKDIEDQINGQLDNIIAEVNAKIQNMIESINSQLGDVNGLINQMNGIQDKANSYVDKVNSYLTRVNNMIERINSRLSNANHYLQVTMLYETSNGSFYQLSNSKMLPTPIKVGGNDAVLYPTSYTAELIAPAYKKFVAVTNVYNGTKSALDGDTDCLEALQAANNSELMNTVVKGTTRAVKFPAPAAKFENYVYEVAYSALDYNGVSSTRKFYVKAVK